MLQNNQLWRDLFQRMHLHHGLPSLHRYQQWSSCKSVQHRSAGQTIECTHETPQFTQSHTRLLGTALFCNCHRSDPLFRVFTFMCNCLMNELYVTGVFFRDVLSRLCCSHFYRLVGMWHNYKHHKKSAPFKSAIMKYYLWVIGQRRHSVTLDGGQEFRGTKAFLKNRSHMT